jgi:hypothetical protein
MTIFLISLPMLIYAQRRSIGEVRPDSNKSTNQLDYPVEQWMGKRFIFLEKTKTLQKHGYLFFCLTKEFPPRPQNINSELEEPITRFLKYDKFVGKTKEVSSLGLCVTFLEEESNMKMYARPHKGRVQGVAFFDDINKARERWLGKTIYSKMKFIRTYDQKLDKYGEEKIGVGDPLKVIDICWGEDLRGPLWLIVETIHGKKGFVATAFSWTNKYLDLWTENRPWEDHLFEFNPRLELKWSDATWELINNGKVRPGMNKEQVELSWGKPKKINEDIYQGLVHEQWIYDNQYLYFDNEILKAIQSR